MALPIKTNDTQAGCNPISSNCVIWQGPDIPCINLCTGDSVSDVVAKMAERLCLIVNQLDMSLLDLSCFNPLCPTVNDIQELLQFILNKICELENVTVDPVQAGGCPDDCIITIAACFQTADFLGNLVTTLSLKDYVVKIGNEICTILTASAANTASIEDLDTRVTFIENNCCSTSPATVNITTPGCIGNNTTKTIQVYLTDFETAFCSLRTATGTPVDINTTLSYQCISGADATLGSVGTYAGLPGWINSPLNLAQNVQDLWLIICDQRLAIQNLQSSLVTVQADLLACCAPTCADIIWMLTGNGIRANKYIDLFFTGSIPAAFDYCGGATGTNIVVRDAFAASYSFTNQDVLSEITSGGTIDLDISTAGTVNVDSVYYEVDISLCLTDGTLTCNSTRSLAFYNINWCSYRLVNISSPSASPGQIDVGWTKATALTTYTVNLYTAANVFVDSASITSGAGGITSVSFVGLTSGTVYKATLTSTQNGRSIDCQTSQIVCA